VFSKRIKKIKNMADEPKMNVRFDIGSDGQVHCLVIAQATTA